MNVIDIKNMKKSYYKEKIEITIINDLSFSFDAGKFYAIVGESGAGKSTLLKCISLLCPLDDGIITINGKNISLLKDDDLANIRLKEIGMIFQDYNLFPYLTSVENVMMPMLFYKDNDLNFCQKLASDMLDYVGLGKRKNHYPNELSGGEQQRVAIARALINNPSIILADEPTGNLDEKNKINILELLKKISNNGKCVIVVTHDNDVLKYADEIYSLNSGKLVKYES